MLNKLLVIVILFGVWQWWSQRYNIDIVDSPVPNMSEMMLPKIPAKSTLVPLAKAPESQSNFQCDGRQHCSQMRSRAEAEFFVANCPNTKMDGDHDGVPCERDRRW